MIRSFLLKLYRLTTDYGPVPRYPCLYWPFRKYINLHVARLWCKHPPIALPDENTELIIASPGHCASHAFYKYITDHNPKRGILLSVHAPAPVLYALKHDIPCLILTKDFFAYVMSSYRSVNPTGFHNPMLFYKMLAPHIDRIFVAKFEDLISDPALVVRHLNDRFQLKLHEGDNSLPQIRTYSTIADKQS